MAFIPSLEALRALEAAGRLMSYSKAGQELGLTHSAVSHRIRMLEGQLGYKLFERDGNAMKPTLEGQALIAQVRQSLSLLEQAFVPHAKRATGPKRVVLSTMPGFASTWLLHRLGDFNAEHPDVEIAIRVSTELADFKTDGVDIAVRYGGGGWADVQAIKIFDEALTPVCSPAYRDKLNLKTPEDLKRATLLRNVWTPWTRWFKAAGLDWPEPTGGPLFDDSQLLLRAAVQDQGVILARHWFAIDDVRAGRLIAPFDLSVGTEHAYWVVWPMGRSEPAPARQFREWLMAAAAQECPPHRLS